MGTKNQVHNTRTEIQHQYKYWWDAVFCVKENDTGKAY